MLKTVYISEKLYAEIKRRAQEQKKRVRALIEELLAEKLESRDTHAPKAKVRETRVAYAVAAPVLTGLVHGPEFEAILDKIVQQVCCGLGVPVPQGPPLSAEEIRAEFARAYAAYPYPLKTAAELVVEMREE